MKYPLDPFRRFWTRLTYCLRHGHLDKGWGYCANCGTRAMRRH